jgi:hypothetical protein
MSPGIGAIKQKKCNAHFLLVKNKTCDPKKREKYQREKFNFLKRAVVKLRMEQLNETGQ